MLVAVATVSMFLGCETCPKKVDPDLEPAPLALDAWSPQQQLACRRGDCIDSYRVEISERGELNVVVATSGGAAAAHPFTLQLQSGARQVLAEAPNAGSGNAALRWKADAGAYLVVVSTSDTSRTPLSYEIRADFEPAPPPPPPPPPKPRFETLTSEVLEVEGRPGTPEAVLIDRGVDAGLRSGLRGRLIDAGRVIATIEIQEAFETGSRARITGTLDGVITPATVAEIDVPLEAR